MSDWMTIREFPLPYQHCYAGHRALKQLGFTELEFTFDFVGEELMVVLSSQGRVLRVSVARLPGETLENVRDTWLALLEVTMGQRQDQLEMFWRKHPLSKNGTVGNMSPFNKLIAAIMKHWIWPPIVKSNMSIAERDKLWGDGPPADHPIEQTFSLVDLLTAPN